MRLLFFYNNLIQAIFNRFSFFSEARHKNQGSNYLKIIEVVLTHFRSKILYNEIIFCLLPEKFTLVQPQDDYKTILEKRAIGQFQTKNYEYVLRNGTIY